MLAGTLAVLLAAIAALSVSLALDQRHHAAARGHPASATTTAGPQAVAPLDLAAVAAPLAAQYRFAAAHADAYRRIPCYCGCQQFLGHRDLADCFVRRDGRGWEAHAAGCGVCQGEAATARQLLQRGIPPAAVAAAVTRQFGPTVATTPPAATAAER